MKVLVLIITLALSVLVAPHAVAAQAPAKAARIGWLRGGPDTPALVPCDVRPSQAILLDDPTVSGHALPQRPIRVARRRV